MPRPMNELQPSLKSSLHGKFQLTYIPVLDKEGLHGAVLVLSDGTPVILAQGFQSSHLAWSACEKATDGEVKSLNIGRAVHPLLHQWSHVPAEAEELARSFACEHVGLPSVVNLSLGLVWDRLILDANQGYLELVSTTDASKLLGISRQAVFSRLRRKSLSEIRLDRDPHRVFCLASEVGEIAGRPPELKRRYVQVL